MVATHFSGPVYSTNGFVGTISDAISTASFIDNSGGVPSDTIVAVPAATAATTDTSAASLTSTNAAITAIRNDIASLTSKVNALIAALD